MILLIDNYDSFTYNLYQMLMDYEEEVLVLRNDACSLDEIKRLQPSAILFSPGAGAPKDAGRMEDIIRAFYKQIPMLGVCLGHQAIGEVFGSEVVQASTICHGVSAPIQIIKEDALFHQVPATFYGARYHSLIIRHPSKALQVLAINKDQEIMAIRHQDYPVYGIQFHPESILTPLGKTMLDNFMKERNQSC